MLFNLYGTSEAGVSIFATPSDLAANPATIGREIWGVTATIRGEGDAILPAGHPGRLCIQSSAAAASKGKWVETGDVASRDAEGRLFLHGRIDEMIVSGGENVSPWEVETVLMRHPEVDEAAAVGVPDVDFGQRLIAFVAPSEGSNLTPEALGAWLAGEVARYQRPRAILFRPELPLTPVGKINKRALRAELETRPEQVGRSGA